MCKQNTHIMRLDHETYPDQKMSKPKSIKNLNLIIDVVDLTIIKQLEN